MLRATLPGMQRLAVRELEAGSSSEASFEAAFTAVCDQLASGRLEADARLLPPDTFERLGRKEVVPGDLSWLQHAASFLAMLMHFSLGGHGSRQLINRRRPNRTGTTYPNSPAVNRILAHYALAHLVDVPVPKRCADGRNADRFAARALRFRLLDPSMESGQLLLETALQIVAAVHRVHPQGSAPARRLTRALLHRLCRHCLWGIDLNPVSPAAVRTVFRLLARSLGIGQIRLENLEVEDSLRGRHVHHEAFDAVLNNPPWGVPDDDEQRERVRGFETVCHRLESYVAFSELAIRSLRPSGIYGLVLPSQAAFTRHSLKLRRLLGAGTQMEHAVLLPRSAFAQATVRGLILLGRLPGIAPVNGSSVRGTIYPLNPSLYANGGCSVRNVPIRRLADGSWRRLFFANERLGRGSAVIPLGRLAAVHGGVGLYTRGSGRPPQTPEIVESRPFDFRAANAETTPAIRGRDVRPFEIRAPDTFVHYGPWLADPGPHGDQLLAERIFVREVCHRNGRLTASPARRGVLPLKGVIAVLPRDIDAALLLAILNSEIAARYVRHNTASFSKVDFQCIKVRELRRFPIPLCALRAGPRRSLGFGAPTRREVGLRVRTANLVRRLLQEGESGMDAVRDQLDRLVNALYGESGGSNDAT